MPFDPHAQWLSIPPAQQPPNHYRLLGLPAFQHDVAVIDAAADRQTAVVESHLTGPYAAEARTLLRQISDARLCLLDEENRSRYDAFLRQSVKSASSSGTSSRSAAPIPVAKIQSAPAASAERPAFPVFDDSSSSGEATVRRAKSGGSHVQWMIKAVAGGAVGLALGYLILVRGFGVDPFNSNPEPPRKSATKDKSPKKKNNAPSNKPSTSSRSESGDGADDRENDEDANHSNRTPPRQDGTLGSLLETPDRTEPRPTPPKEKPEKLDPPDDAARAESLAMVKELYAEDYNQAESGSQRQALARRLFSLAEQSAEDPAGRFVLLAEARDVATAAGDAELTMQAITRLDELYKIDPWPMRASALAAWSEMPMPRERRVELARVIIPVATQAVAAEQYDVGLRLWTLAREMARRGGHTGLVKQANEQAKQAETQKNRLGKIQQALAALDADPHDAAANLLVGHYHSVLRGDWETGLPFLARGGNEQLRQLAQQDLAGTDDANGAEAIGDAWWDFAQTASEDAKQALLDRAGHWYAQARPTLSGLRLARIDKRLAEISAATAGASEPVVARRDPFGFGYLALEAHQAGSTVEVDDLTIKDLESGEVVYANDFDTGDVGDLALLFRADDQAPWNANPQMTRFVGGRLRLECIGFGRNGAGGYDSCATMVLGKKLPSNFELDLVVNKLQYEGNFVLQICMDESMKQSVFYLKIDGRSLRQVEVVDPVSVAGPLRGRSILSTRPSSLQGSDVQISLKKNDNTVAISINGTTVATANDLAAFSK